MPRIATKEEEREIERLMDVYGRALKRMCCLYLKDVSLAEDASQETFLRAWRHLGDFRRESSEKTWLMRIAMNVCRDMLRTGWFRHLDRRVTPEELPLVSEMDEERPLLAEQVMALPPKYREPILLYYYQDMDTKEMARALGVSFNTAKSRLLRARALLKKELEGGGKR